MKILILCHIEETFRKHFPNGMLDAIIEQSSQYNRVIHMTSEVCDDEPVEELRWIVDEEIAWGWGYEPRATCEYCYGAAKHDSQTCLCVDCGGEETWIIKVDYSVHEWTLVPEELRNGRFENAEITIGGGYDGECLADLEAVLEYMDVPYRRERDFIYP
jgi:hypothetical protein